MCWSQKKGSPYDFPNWQPLLGKKEILKRLYIAKFEGHEWQFTCAYISVIIGPISPA